MEQIRQQLTDTAKQPRICKKPVFAVQSTFRRGVTPSFYCCVCLHERSRKIVSASRQYDAKATSNSYHDIRLVGHAATLYVEPDLRLKPEQVWIEALTAQTASICWPTGFPPVQLQRIRKSACRIFILKPGLEFDNGIYVSTVVVRPSGDHPD